MLKERGVYTICAIISLILVILSPKQYSFEFCFGVMLLFLLENIFYFKNNPEGRLGFEVFFATGFFITTFIHPIFLIGTIADSLGSFGRGYDISVVNYSTSISMLAYSCLILGCNYKSRQNAGFKKSLSRQVPFKPVFWAFLVVYLLFIVTGGYDVYRQTYLDENIESSGLSSQILFLFQSVLLIAITFFFDNRKTYEKWKFVMLPFICFIVVSILLTGSRTIPLEVCILVLCMYTRNIKKIKMKYLIPGALLTLSFFMLVGLLRGQDDPDAVEMDGLTNKGPMELVGSNWCTYYLVSATHKDGYQYLLPISSVFSSIPLVGSHISSVFGSTGSGAYIVNLVNDGHKAGAFGTSIVGDVYLFGGILPVVFFFYLLGRLLSYSKRHINNEYMKMLFYLFVSQSLYMCRNEFFGFLKLFVFECIVLYFITHFVYREKESVIVKMSA